MRVSCSTSFHHSATFISLISVILTSWSNTFYFVLNNQATSALDKETSQSIIQTLLNLRDNDGLTIVSVSHHPETAMKADKIVVLKRGGVVVEEGTYDELASREGSIFHRLVNAGS